MKIEDIRLTAEEIRDARIQVEVYHKSPAHTLAEEEEFVIMGANTATDKAIEKIIDEVEDMDKRHTISFVLQALKKLAK